MAAALSEVCGHLLGMPSGRLLLEAYQASGIGSPAGPDEEPNVTADGWVGTVG